MGADLSVLRALRGQERMNDARLPQENRSDFITPYLQLPGLVGFWPVSSIDRSSSQIIDLSGQDRHLSQSGNPLKNYTAGGAPYITLDGGGDYVSRTSEADLQITGTENDYAAAIRGLTIICWINPTTVASSFGIFGKYASTGNQRSYLLYVPSGGAGYVDFVISVDGTATVSVRASSVITTGVWHCVVGRFSPSNSLDVCLDGVWARNTTSIPASIFAGTAALQGGAIESASTMTGGWSQACLCAAYCSDGQLGRMFRRVRPFLGV